MLRPPRTDLELEELVHFAGSSIAGAYDPVKAHEYYLRTRKLRGRKRGQAVDPTSSTDGRGLPKWRDPRTGKTAVQIHKEAVARQKKDLSAAINRMEGKLNKLEALIRRKEHEAASEDRKSKAKKERAAKEKDKPKTAAEKAQTARENEKYRDKHKQKLKTEAKKDASKSGGGSSSKSSKKVSSKSSVTELKALATKVKGQIAVAKQKLAAL